MKPTSVMVLAFVLMIAAYASTVRAPFVYEDSNAVQGNPAVQGLEPINVLRTRWLTSTVHRVNRTLFGPSPASFHAVNVGLHAINGGLVFLLALSLTGRKDIAAMAAGMFLLHPLQTEAVAYVASRSELLATMGVLGAITLVVRGWNVLLVLFVGLLALCAKESAIVLLPLLVLVATLEVSLPRLRRVLSPGVVLSAAALVAGAVTLVNTVLKYEYAARVDISAWVYAGRQAAAFWRMLSLVALPIGLSIDHDFDAVAPWVGWAAIYLLVAVTANVVMLWLFRRESKDAARWTTIVFGSAWVLVALAPRFVMRIHEYINEHQMYLPMVGLALMFACLVDMMRDRVATREERRAWQRAWGRSEMKVEVHG